MSHDLITPSGYATWSQCPAAPLVSKYAPPEPPSRYADEGTRAHRNAYLFAAQLAGLDVSAEGEIDCDDEAMAHACRGWGAITRRILNKVSDPFVFGFESQVELYPITGRNARGTIDFWALDDDGTLYVCDLKYGMGVSVQAKRNGQLSTYAAALMAGLSADVKRIVIMIYQPRLYDVPSTWEPSLEEFNAFVADIKVAAAKANAVLARGVAERADFNPGESQCRFCKAKPVCPALRAKVEGAIAQTFDTLPDPEASPVRVPSAPEELARVLPWLDTIESWCAACKATALDQLKAGTAIPGYKLVAGRKGRRTWVEGAEEAINAMRIKKDDLYEKKLITPTKAEKLVRTGAIGPRQWEKIQGLITQSEGSPTVVPASDPRPELLAHDAFDVLPEAEQTQRNDFDFI